MTNKSFPSLLVCFSLTRLCFRLYKTLGPFGNVNVI